MLKTRKEFVWLHCFYSITLLLAACAGSALASENYGSPSLSPAKGSLVIVGGGKLSPEIIHRFVSLAGGENASFVVIPTASSDNDLNLKTLPESFVKKLA